MQQKELYKLVSRALCAADEARRNGKRAFHFSDGRKWPDISWYVADKFGIVDGPYANELAAVASAAMENGESNSSQHEL
jgi:hypothetical protein